VAREGWRIVAVECRTPDGGVPFPVDGIPFAISGRIDRIDHHPELGWAVLDYKTGDRGETPEQTHRKGRGEARVWIDLQLPLYRHILPAVQDARGETPFSGGPGEPVRLGYVLLPRDTDRVGAALAEWDGEVLDTADEQAREVVRTVRRNRFAFQDDRITPWMAGDLAPLLGMGLLASAEPEEEE
jgi:ATP-dependent helicase/nuclease subunit B